MEELFLLGNESCALGALDAGISHAYGYPGTPSTEIMNYIGSGKYRTSAAASWCTNEKTAFEAAVGASYIGKRSLVVMKHVGLNVAADAFVNAVLQEINGGLVIVAADDPGMHSSQNEQDSRFYADFARTICLEPGDHQEAYAMMLDAFDVSERFHIPVLFRMVTRLSHSRAIVKRKPVPVSEPVSLVQAAGPWICLPLFARKNNRRLLDNQKLFREYSETAPCTTLEINESFRKFGIITCGIAGQYFREIVSDLSQRPSHLHVGTYPVAVEKVRQLAAEVESIIVIEEGYPFVERQLRSLISDPLPIRGKLDGTIPDAGELTPDLVFESLSSPAGGTQELPLPDIPVRFSQLCTGCPHIDTFKFVQAARKRYTDLIVMADIGCYTLGALPPYSLLDCAICMGASISMARGAADAGARHVVALIGDSSFLHTGIAPLIDAVAASVPLVVLILDNRTVAMTGGQPTILHSDSLPDLIAGTGVDSKHIRKVVPLPSHHAANTALLEQELDFRGVSVIISRRECVRKTNKTHPGAPNHEI